MSVNSMLHVSCNKRHVVVDFGDHRLLTLNSSEAIQLGRHLCYQGHYIKASREHEGKQ